jgi:hypothetical protein
MHYVQIHVIHQYHKPLELKDKPIQLKDEKAEVNRKNGSIERRADIHAFGFLIYTRKNYEHAV